LNVKDTVTAKPIILGDLLKTTTGEMTDVKVAPITNKELGFVFSIDITNVAIVCERLNPVIKFIIDDGLLDFYSFSDGMIVLTIYLEPLDLYFAQGTKVGESLCPGSNACEAKCMSTFLWHCPIIIHFL
jgi:hypothetical protein